MGQTSTTFVHPLKSVVIEEERRDPVGHLVNDVIADREFRFVKLRGGHTASQGLPVVGWRLSAISSDPFNVTVDGAASVSGGPRDFIGIVVGQSTAVSGDLCYVMTRGRLGKIDGGLYPDTIFALVSATVVGGHQLAISNSLSTWKLFRQPSAFDATSAGEGQSTHAKVCALALSTDVGDKLTRGVIRSPLLHGGGGFGPPA